MKIVNRATFMSLPKGTVFMFGPTQDGTLTVPSDGLFIKGESLPNDFYYRSLVDVDAESSDAYMDISDIQIAKAVSVGSSDEIGMVFGVCERDGVYDDTALYVVFTEAEVASMVAILSSIPDER